MNPDTEALDRLSFDALTSLFLDTKKACCFLGADAADIGELYYTYGEFACEILKRPEGKTFARSKIRSWEPLRQASFLSIWKIETDDHWVADFAASNLNSENERLRSAALEVVARKQCCDIEKLLEKFAVDSSPYVRGVAYSENGKTVLAQSKKSIEIGVGNQ